MVARFLRGKLSTGTYGFYVSKPGFDVTTASLIQLAFSSDYIHPKVVVQGTVTSAPVSAVAPFGSGTSNGAAETLTSISYGQTLSSIPAAFMIATASDWTITLANNNGALTALQGVWHTQIMETCYASTNIGDYWPGKNLVKDGASTNDHLRTDWFSARAVCVPYTDHVEFHTNCKSTVTIKYLVLQNQ